MNADELLRRKIARAEAKVSILENMIEDKTRDLYLAEQELKRRNAFLASVVDTLPNTFIVIDAIDRRIMLKNSVAHLGPLPEGTTCHSLIYGSDRPCEDPLLPCPLDIMRKTGRALMVERTVADKAGNPRNYNVHCYPVFDDNGNVAQMIRYAIDVTEEKRAKDALTESEARLKTILNSQPTGIMIVDAASHLIVDVNTMVCGMIGEAEERIVGTACDGYLPDDAAKGCVCPAPGRSTEISSEALLRTDGTRIPVLKTVAGVVLKGRMHAIVSLLDVTESAKAQARMKESEEKFRSIFESSNDAMMLLGERGFTDCNAATLRMFDCGTREEFCGKSPAEWSPPAQPDGSGSGRAAEERIAGAYRDGRAFFEWSHRRRNGKYSRPRCCSLRRTSRDET